MSGRLSRDTSVDDGPPPVQWRQSWDATPRLAELRSPPEVGRYYLVPVIRHPWHGRWRDWPVLGPVHTDVDFFRFSAPHFHVDIRFLDRRTSLWAARRLPFSYMVDSERDLALVASTFPLGSHGVPLARRPHLGRIRCFRASYASPLGDAAHEAVKQMQAHYGATAAEPIVRRDGRKLCPHRKVDLSQFVPDTDGIVVCPLHGLRVRCGEAVAA